mgnify:CR=1 FL=1
MKRIMLVLIIFSLFSVLVIYRTDTYHLNQTTQKNTTVITECTDELELTTTNTDIVENEIMNNMEYIYNEIIERFIISRENFEKTVDLMLGCEEPSILISFDRDNYMLRVSIDNEIIPVEDLFENSEIELILNCFVQMSKACSEEVRLVISKQSPKDYWSIDSTSVIFMFRTNFDSEYVDYGITYCRNIGDSNYKKIEDNWYWFEFWLV